MIGRLTGKLVVEEPDGTVLIDVAGVGYEVSTPVGTSRRVESGPEPGTVILYIHTHVREESIELFGFASESERRLFRLVTAVQKIGPKIALGLLSALAPDDLARAIRESDLGRLCRVPGIGKKTAERLVLELRDKVPMVGRTGPPTGGRLGAQGSRLVAALVSMGYKAVEAERAVRSLGGEIESEPMADALRAALARLVAPRNA